MFVDETLYNWNTNSTPFKGVAFPITEKSEKLTKFKELDNLKLKLFVGFLNYKDLLLSSSIILDSAQ